jgi:hypothetical protein
MVGSNVHSVDGMRPSVHGQWPKREGYGNSRPLDLAAPEGKLARHFNAQGPSWGPRPGDACLSDMHAPAPIYEQQTYNDPNSKTRMLGGSISCLVALKPRPRNPRIPVPPRPDLAGKIAGTLPIPIGRYRENIRDLRPDPIRPGFREIGESRFGRNREIYSRDLRLN